MASAGDQSAGRQDTAGWQIYNRFTIITAKKTAFYFVLILFSSRIVSYYLYGPPDTCKSLVTEGYYLDTTEWQPDGCLTHRYSQSESLKCLLKKEIFFIGDSRIRSMYYALVNYLGGTTPQNEVETLVHHDLSASFANEQLTINFLWHPVLNASVYNLYKEWTKAYKRRDIIVHGSFLWSIKESNASPKSLQQFKANFSALAPLMELLAYEYDTSVYWVEQAPVEHEKLWQSRKMITNAEIEKYNAAVTEVLASQFDVRLWRSASQVAALSTNFTTDGLHLRQPLLDTTIQLLLNRECNHDYKPQDGQIYCCQPVEDFTIPQIICAIIFSSSMIVALFMKIIRGRRSSEPAQNLETGQALVAANGNGSVQTTDPAKEGAAKAGKPEPTATHKLQEALFALGKFGLILFYFYVCDRTLLFSKEGKHYTAYKFFFPFVYLTILGLFFTLETKQKTLLNREQTEEWKGWMQLYILIYHITGASSVVPIYMHIRVLVGMYLFQTGYNHFTFFFKKGNFGLVRICQVMFRLNWLVFCLCLVMNRPYQFYYFVPLVTFWFFFIYALMACYPRVSAQSAADDRWQYLWLSLKFAVALLLLLALSCSQRLFYGLFGWWPLSTLFTLPQSDPLHEWWFRWQLDRYIVVYGMMFAFVYLLAKKSDIIQDESRENLFKMPVTVLISAASLCGILGYTFFTFHCGSKPDCNQTYTYLSLLAITCFILVRNSSGKLRERYSSFFAWFGKISLELFIGQYHIWLAADTKGVLVLIPGYPHLNLIATTFIFVCVAHEIFETTGVLANYVVPQDWWSAFKRTIIFFCILFTLSVYSKIITI